MNNKWKIISCLLIIMFFITSCTSLKDNESSEDNFIEDKRDLTEEENEKLLDIINDLEYLDFLGKSFVTTDLTNQEVLQFAANLVDTVDGTSFSTLDDLAQKYLNFYLEPENILCVTHFNVLGASDYLYLYDGDTKSFVYNDSHVGHASAGFYSLVFNQYVSSYMEDDIYTIVVYKVFSEILWSNYYDTYVFYPTYNDAYNNTNKLFESLEGDVIDKINSLDESDGLVSYTYEFLLVDGNYVLRSYTINE